MYVLQQLLYVYGTSVFQTIFEQCYFIRGVEVIVVVVVVVVVVVAVLAAVAVLIVVHTYLAVPNKGQEVTYSILYILFYCHINSIL